MRLIIFFPVAFLWSIILRVRNFLFDQNILRSHKFPFPVIVIGNLTLGGTGKTPFVDWLVQHLKSHCEVIVLSRGYGRKSKGFYEVTSDGNGQLYGDEPMMLKIRHPNVKIYVGENRVNALQKISDEIHSPTAILDDAFQHRKLKPGLSILLFNSLELDKLWMFPAGRLRDNLYRIHQADIIIFTKCTEDTRAKVSSAIANRFRFSAHQSVFFTGIEYAPAIPLFASSKPLPEYEQFILLSGIADPSPLQNYLNDNRKKLLKHFRFADHHTFSKANLQHVRNYFDNIAQEKTVIFTTEKDAARLHNHAHKKILEPLPVFVIPMRMHFFEKNDEQLLIHKILTYAKTNS